MHQGNQKAIRLNVCLAILGIGFEFMMPYLFCWSFCHATLSFKGIARHHLDCLCLWYNLHCANLKFCAQVKCCMCQNSLASSVALNFGSTKPKGSVSQSHGLDRGLDTQLTSYGQFMHW